MTGRLGRLKVAVVIALICAGAGVLFVLIRQSVSSPQIRIEDQEGRVSPVLLGVCSVFMRIENAGDSGDDLTGARVEIPGVITEIHDVEEGKMVWRKEVHIPARSTIAMRPMSYHIMAYKMPRDIKEGYEFTLLLKFEKSGEMKIAVKLVR